MARYDGRRYRLRQTSLVRLDGIVEHYNLLNDKPDAPTYSQETSQSLIDEFM